MGIFPTVSYRFSSPEGVRSDVAEARKGSSYAKHCNLLIPLAAGNGFKKIPLPAPQILFCFEKPAGVQSVSPRLIPCAKLPPCSKTAVIRSGLKPEFGNRQISPIQMSLS